MTDLEKQVNDLRMMLVALAERVRLDAVADAFLRGNHDIRSGDFVRFSDDHAAHVFISSEGKWTYTDRHGRHIEPFRAPPEDGIERLYTIAEVAEIVSKARRL